MKLSKNQKNLLPFLAADSEYSQVIYSSQDIFFGHRKQFAADRGVLQKPAPDDHKAFDALEFPNRRPSIASIGVYRIPLYHQPVKSSEHFFLVSPGSVVKVKIGASLPVLAAPPIPLKQQELPETLWADDRVSLGNRLGGRVRPNSPGENPLDESGKMDTLNLVQTVQT